MAHHGAVVNFAQEDFVVGLGVLMQLQVTGHFIGQLAEAADALPFAQNVGGDAGVQPADVGCPFHVEGQAQGFAQGFHGSLHGEEVLPFAESGEAQVGPFIRQVAAPRDIDIADLENPSFVVALLQVFHHNVHQAGN